MYQVLRSEPKGIDLMHHYPNVANDPGMEEWLPKDKWVFERVFDDVIRRWTYDDANKADGFREEWKELRKWHVAYTDSSAVEL
eukprot:1371765-Pleurochrysis_carterae.AAC.1